MYKLMIVDDSNIIRKRIQRIYDNSKFTLVATAANGVEAIEKFTIHRPNIITMDITMPHMNGLECIKKMVAIDESVKILVISALSDQETGIDALDVGATGFLCKPFTPEKLVSSLERLTHDL